MKANNISSRFENYAMIVETMNADFKGNVFIIPNGLASAANTCGQSRDERDTSFAEHAERYHRNVIVPDDDQYVELWCVTPGDNNSNWQAHGDIPVKELPVDEDGDPIIRFPSHLPVHLFKGKKEGDTVKLITVWGVCELTLAQLPYRYRRFGAFEKVLSELIINDLEWKKKHYDTLSE